MPIFDRHFTLDEANALLPDLRRWFGEIAALVERLTPLGEAHAALL